YTLPEIIAIPEKSEKLTLRQLWERASSDLGSKEIVVEFSRDIIHKLVCPGCGREEEIFAPAGSVSYEAGRCAADGQMRAVHSIHSYDGSQDLGSRKLTELGLPGFDIFTARNTEREIGYLLNGDAESVLGALAKEQV